MKLSKLFVFTFLFLTFLLTSSNHAYATLTVNVTTTTPSIAYNGQARVIWDVLPDPAPAGTICNESSEDTNGMGGSAAHGDFYVTLSRTNHFTVTCTSPDQIVVTDVGANYEYNLGGWSDGISSSVCVSSPVTQTKQFWVDSMFYNWYTSQQQGNDQYVTIYAGQTCSDNYQMVNFSPMGNQDWTDNYWYRYGNACVYPFPDSTDILLNGYGC